MDHLFHVIILAIIEGITEFLPVSSTGHMILASSVMGIEKDKFIQLFEIVVQLGAILSVVVYYRKKFFPLNKWNFYFKLIVAVIPALALGAIFSKKIHVLLGMPIVTSISLFIGGIVLLFIDKLFKNPTTENVDDVSYKQGFFIGVWQCLAMIPGTSRSAASIIGGMQQKLNRAAAAEFSFFLAVPTMCAATGKDLLDAYKEMPEVMKDHNSWILIGIGFVIAFIVALLAIKFFIGYVQKYGFKLFGWYRIIVGGIFLVLCLNGTIQNNEPEQPNTPSAQTAPSIDNSNQTTAIH
ncbi:MAG: undecaprenyl-diphosphate phosphatase [Pseudopedobacter saltans]|uniref:Undecaprenyl-diphosphatase n=1 Tax=Pseudopedobacter saltans TaxID=151895 RepID=A0A2W5EF14_9SPHI|nr:MAG: undecaprenyl-diphosphate phosphatase [Pseudopedobacter saltans]